MSQEDLKLGLLCTAQAAAWIAKYLGWDTVGELTLDGNMVLPRFKNKTKRCNSICKCLGDVSRTEWKIMA